MAILGMGFVVVATAAVVGGKWGLPIVLGLALAAPLAIALRRRPQRGVLVLVALAPFDGLLLIAHLPSSVHIWKEVVVLATLVATLVAPTEARGPRGRRLPSWAPAVGGLLVLGLASGFAVGGQQALTGFRIDFFYVLLALAVWRCPLSDREQDRLVTVLMITGIVCAMVGIAQQVIGADRLHALGYPYNTVITTASGHLRSFSTFASNFGFAFYLMAIVIVGLPSALSDTRRPRNVAFLGFLPVIGVALLFTFTRGAWLGLAAAVVYLGFRRYRLLLLVVPVALLAFAYLPGSVTSTSFSAKSLGQRSAGWQSNLHQVVTHPFGSGIGATGAAAEKVASLQAHGASVDTTMPGTPTYQPDNYYYEVVYDFGVLGLWMWVLLLVASFAAASLASRSRDGPASALATGVAALVVAAAVASLVATYFEIFPMDLLFWLLIATIAAGGRKSRGADEPNPAAVGRDSQMPAWGTRGPGYKDARMHDL